MMRSKKRRYTGGVPKRFLSCDWGTSRLRIRLVEGADLAVSAAVESADGIGPVYARWSGTRGRRPSRTKFYLSVLGERISALENDFGAKLSGVPMIISGMASSTIGMADIPYKRVPFAVDGSDLRTQLFEASGDFAHDILMISGVRDARDVMRGEEVQLVGALANARPLAGSRLLVFPGTHSKHVVVSGESAVGVQTYMTGELFDLLVRRSVLANSVRAQGTLKSRAFRRAFEEGVRVGKEGNLLNTLFSVRVRGLLQQIGKAENFHYLSGMVLGCELKDLAQWDSAPPLIVASPEAADRYRTAMSVVGIRGKILEAGVEESLIKGQARIAARAGMFGMKETGGTAV
jgi:2-dehydro-3-deoxygalactonokinase